MSTHEPNRIVDIATWLTTYAVHGVMWFALAWSLVRLLKTPQLREWTWKASVVGALFSAGMIGEWGAGERPLIWRVEKSSSIASTPEVQSGEMMIAAGEVAPKAVGAGASRVPAQSVEASEAASGSAGSAVPFVSILVAGWALGAVLCVAQLLLSRRRCLKELRTESDRPEASTQRLIERLIYKSGCRRSVNLRITRALVTPIASAGGGLYLPRQVVETMTDEEQEAVLAHELAHIVRFDPEWQLALALLSRVFFFLPLLRFSARRIETEAELLCDDRAVLWSGNAIALARGLRHVAIWSVETERVPSFNGAAMVASSEPESSAIVSRVERLLVRPELPTSRLARVATLVCLTGFTTAMACAGPELSSDDRAKRISVEFHSEQSEEDPDGWKMFVPKDPVDRSEYETEDFHITVSLLEDGRVSVLMPNDRRTERLLIRVRSVVVLSGLNPNNLDYIFRPFRDSPANTDIPVVLNIAPSSESRAWLRLLEIIATRGEHSIAFELEGDRHVPASMPFDGTADPHPLDPSFLEINLSVLNAGEKVDVDFGDAGEGSGRFTFKDRRILYTATSEAKVPDGSGMATSQGMAVDSIAGISQYLSSEKSKAPELGARIQAGEGTIYGDVVPLLDALLEAGFVDIVFLEYMP